MSLSEENYNKLNENFLYKKSPVIDNSFSVGKTPATYHCKNWTFKVYKRNGTAIMVDTYWSTSQDSLSFDVSDENINDFEKIFDFNEVRNISDEEWDEYEPEQLLYAATDSGGYSCGRLYWVRKDAKKSNNKLIEKTRSHIESLKRNLESEERLLNNLLNFK